jgi:two-component system, chemotaxis family, CheB/CheR fusion protein
MTAILPAEPSDALPSETSIIPTHVVGIGASAGGIPVLRQFFAAMPSDSGMAFIVVLHLSPDHESLLASILQTETAMRVLQVQGTLTLDANTVYVNPPGHHMSVSDGSVSLIEPEPARGRRVPIDELFRTLGEAYRENCICVILSGTGADGTLGMKRVKESGGISIVQDPEEAEFDAMPRSAIATNLVDLILPIAEIPAKLLSLRASQPYADADHGSKRSESVPIDALRETLTLLRIRTGHDFSGYKRTTLLRRIARRMSVGGVDSVGDYLEFLQSNPRELESLLRDLLISVTNFFRDAEAFDELERSVIPRVFEGKGSDDVVRVWTVACATGEEAYTVAMLLSEHAMTLESPPRIQVFASDIDAAAIATAREGRYNDTIALDVSTERLERFFIEERGEYRVKKSLREMVLFTQHNVLSDPPFSQLDLVSCRNLLIYLDREAQTFVLRTIHFALRRGGHLMLGSSETVESLAPQFAIVDRRRRLYRSKGGQGVYPAMQSRSLHDTLNATDQRSEPAPKKTSFGEIHHRLVERYAPPSLLVNDVLDVVHVSERAGVFLQFKGGDVSRNVLALVLPSLRSHLRDAISAARHTGIAAEAQRLVIDRDGVIAKLDLIVRPFESPGGDEHYFVILFDESLDPLDAPVVRVIEDAAVESHVQRLENELVMAREALDSRSEQSEVSDQELRSSNEELQSIIEELRSASEELETSKEELQSVNEELSTVNQELKNKIDEVSIANADLQNLLSATDIATVFLDGNLLIRRFTALATGLFNLIDSDIGRPLTDLTHSLDYDDLGADVVEVLRTREAKDREVRAADGRTFIARLIPYNTLEGRVEGVVLTLIDISDRKSGEETCEWLSAIVSSSNDAIISFTLDGTVVSWNGSAEHLFGYSSDEMLGQSVQRLSVATHPGELREIFGRISRGEEIKHYETERIRKDGERLNISMSVSPITQAGSAMRGVTAIVQDVTEQRRVRAEIEELSRRKDEFLAMLAHELRNPLAPIMSGVEVIRGADGDPYQIEMAAGIIERQTLQMVRLVNDLLDVSRITNGAIRLQKERIEVQRVVALAMETIRGQLDAAGQTFTLSLPERPVYIDADPARITQVIVNLVSNAGKYMDPGGHVELSAAIESGTVVLSICDTGIGISADMLSTIFEMFAQIESGRRHQRGGLGVGLSVVRTLVEMHGGTVEAQSNGEGKGSIFIVRLPLAASQTEAMVSLSLLEPVIAPPHAATPANLRVLVVDDNVDAARMLCELLMYHDHDVRTANDGASALKTAALFRPNVCLLDIGLPDIDGYEVARRIRATDPSVLLIALTGWGHDDDRRRSRVAGFDHHVVKPVDSAVLNRLIAAGRPHIVP